MSVAPLQGLILAGGASSRMQRDKAALTYQGKSQLDRVFELAARHVDRVFVSVRAAQATDPARAGKPLILDAFDGGGPIIGIRSALAHRPGSAFLVLACDLPFLSDAAVGRLLAARDPQRLATAYSSAHDGLPEPLCAIWEPAAAAALAAFQAGGRSCPRKFLITHDAKLIAPFDTRALDNVNTPEEYAAAVRALAGGPTMQLKVQYYAVMREQAGRSAETLETAAATPADLYSELRTRYGFTLAREQLKVAVNSEFSDWTRPLAAGDDVVFIPPVAGG
jgi:molybdopterin-guanine dinucleotide biosynthesis protein A